MSRPPPPTAFRLRWITPARLGVVLHRALRRHGERLAAVAGGRWLPPTIDDCERQATEMLRYATTGWHTEFPLQRPAAMLDLFGYDLSAGPADELDHVLRVMAARDDLVAGRPLTAAKVALLADVEPRTVLGWDHRGALTVQEAKVPKTYKADAVRVLLARPPGRARFAASEGRA